jgi:hypothetical protein
MLQESPLPHSARTIAFLDSDVVCLAYEADHVLFSLDTMSTIEVASAPPTSKSGPGIGNVGMGMGMGALTGLGGYMTLSLGSKLRPCVTNVGDGQVLIAKDRRCTSSLSRLRLIAPQMRASSSVWMASHHERRIYPGRHLQRMLVRRTNVPSGIDK